MVVPESDTVREQTDGCTCRQADGSDEDALWLCRDGRMYLVDKQCPVHGALVRKWS